MVKAVMTRRDEGIAPYRTLAMTQGGKLAMITRRDEGIAPYRTPAMTRR